MNTGGHEHFFNKLFLHGNCARIRKPRCHGNKAQSMYMSATLYVREHKGATSYFFINLFFILPHALLPTVYTGLCVIDSLTCLCAQRQGGCLRYSPARLPSFPKSAHRKKGNKSKGAGCICQTKAEKVRKTGKKCKHEKKRTTLKLKKKKKRGKGRMRTFLQSLEGVSH